MKKLLLNHSRLLNFLKKLILFLLKFVGQGLLVWLLCVISLTIFTFTRFYFRSIPAFIHLDFESQLNLTTFGWLIFSVTCLISLYPFKIFKFIYGEFICVYFSSLIIPILLYGNVYVGEDSLLPSIIVLVVYYELVYKKYLLKDSLKFIIKKIKSSKT